MLPFDYSKQQDNWIKIFDVPETKLHPDGYTLYKISSTVFQREYPEAETSLHIWRRYSSVKSLQKDISKLHLKFELPGAPPQFAKTSLLANRFDEAIIENRRKMTLNLLQHCAYHRALFSSEQFLNFFKEEELPKRNQYFKKRKSLIRYPSPETTFNVLDIPALEPISDTAVADGALSSKLEDDPKSVSIKEIDNMDALATQQSDLSSPAYTDISSLPQKKFVLEKLPFACDLEKIESSCSSPIPDEDSKIKVNFEPTLFEHISEEDISLVSNCQVKFQSIDKSKPIIRNNECDEKNLMKRKTSEYLLKVEHLMNRFSIRDGKLNQSGSMRNNGLKSTSNQNSYLKNYKVIGMAGKCILALDILTQETVAIKVIEKSEKELKIVPPCHIPFMVPVLRYHEGEYAIYVVLKYIG